MQRRVVNPPTWKEPKGFCQSIELQGGGSTLYCSGLVSFDENGKLLHEGDLQSQALRAIDNLETVLAAADYSLSDVVKLNTYVTDIGEYAKASSAIAERFAAAGCLFTATLLGVTSLARPELLIEIEAVAAK